MLDLEATGKLSARLLDAWTQAWAQEVYARLGVPEIWRWRDDRLAVLIRQPDGTYAQQERSLALPDFPLADLAAALR